MRKSFKKVVTAVMAMALALAAVPGVALADESSEEAIAAGKEAFDASGETEYHAYLQFQVDQSWVFRDTWTNPTTGRSYADFDKVLTTLEVEDPVVVDGTITDAVIKGNGTYTVKVEGLNNCTTTNASAAVKILGVSTDIPSSSNVQITDVKTKIDNITAKEQPTAIIDSEEEERSKTMTVLCANLYRGTEDLSTEFKVPTDSIEVTFTVAGFDVDNPDATEETPAPTQSENNSSSSDESSSSISAPVVVGIVVVVVVVIGAVIVVSKKKKN